MCLGWDVGQVGAERQGHSTLFMRLTQQGRAEAHVARPKGIAGKEAQWDKESLVFDRRGKFGMVW